MARNAKSGAETFAFRSVNLHSLHYLKQSKPPERFGLRKSLSPPPDLCGAELMDGGTGESGTKLNYVYIATVMCGECVVSNDNGAVGGVEILAKYVSKSYEKSNGTFRCT